MALTIKDRKHLEWIHDRLVYVHGESPNADFLIRLKDIYRYRHDFKKVNK